MTAQRASATALQIVRVEPRAPARHPGGPGAKREFLGNLQRESDPERTVAQPRSEPLYRALRLVAPGTPLRDGIDRILQAKMGALIVVGDGPEVLGEIRLMIAELERRARKLGDGDAGP